MVTRIRKACARLVEHNNEKSYVIYLRLAHPVEHVRKIDDVNVLVTDTEVSVSWKKFLHDCAELLPESLQNMNAEDTTSILASASVELNIKNYKAGEEYTREDGSVDKYTAAGTEVSIENLKLSQLTVDEFERDQKLRKDVAAKVGVLLDEFKSRNLDATKLTFSL